jgi:hypothetical protein
MRRIKDIVSKPSQLIIAMCDGLEKQNKRRSFRVRMDTFGASRGKVCYGCAATCALSDIFGYFSIKMPPRGRLLKEIQDRFFSLPVMDSYDINKIKQFRAYGEYLASLGY